MTEKFSFEIDRSFDIERSSLYRALLDEKVLQSLRGLHKLTWQDSILRSAYAEMRTGTLR